MITSELGTEKNPSSFYMESRLWLSKRKSKEMRYEVVLIKTLWLAQELLQ
jgi:hypothetical protein